MDQQSLPLEQKTRRYLTGKESFALAAFVLAEYAKAGLTDGAFAEKASAFLGIEGLNDKHILSTRKIHDIPATRFVKAREKVESKPSKVDEKLADRILSLEKQVRKLFALVEEGKKDVSYQHAEPTEEQAYNLWMHFYRDNPTGPIENRAYRFAKAVLRGAWKQE